MFLRGKIDQLNNFALNIRELPLTVQTNQLTIVNKKGEPFDSPFHFKR
jgi:hypothetical protein